MATRRGFLLGAAATLVSVSLSRRAAAHDSHLSTFHLRETPDGWTLELRVAQNAIDVALSATGETVLNANKQPKAYRAATAKLLRDTVQLQFDSVTVPLQQIGMKLGDHESQFRILLPRPERQPTNISISVRTFASLPEHHSLVRLDAWGLSARQFATEKNGFSVQFGSDAPSPVPGTSEPEHAHPHEHQHERSSNRLSHAHDARGSHPWLWGGAGVVAVATLTAFRTSRPDAPGKPDDPAS